MTRGAQPPCRRGRTLKRVGEDLVRDGLRTRAGRVAFKKGSTSWVVAMPLHFSHASRPSAFRAPGWGAPALSSSCCGRSATSWRLVPFSHRSASRIFIRQPSRLPPPMGNLVERSEPGCGLRPALSFKDFRHLDWGGGRAEPEPYLGVGWCLASSSSFWGGNHPPALRRRRPPAMPGEANYCCLARVQHSVLYPGDDGQPHRGGLTTRRTPRGLYSCSGMVPFSFSWQGRE
jgi:hypothetical protein